jgi:hypothetical protein
MLNPKMKIRRNGYSWTVSKPVESMPGFVTERHFMYRWQARQYVRQQQEQQKC